MTLENASDVAAKFEFSKVAQFNVTPARGRIAGRAKTTGQVEFYPAQIGNFDMKCFLKVEGGLSTQTLRMLGKAVQAAKVVESQMASVDPSSLRHGPAWLPWPPLPPFPPLVASPFSHPLSSCPSPLSPSRIPHPSKGP